MLAGLRVSRARRLGLRSGGPVIARWAGRAGRRGARGVLAAVLAPLVAAAQVLIPVAVLATVAAVAATVARPGAAKAASQSVLILSTSVNGGTASAEAAAVPSGDSVTVVTPSQW